MTDRNETGDDGTLVVNGREIPFTNAGFSLSYDTSESNFNDGLSQDSSHTAKSASGTIEADGSKAELKSLILDSDAEPADNIRIMITGSEGGFRFTDVMIDEFGREYPGGDKTTTEVSWSSYNFRMV